MWVIKCPHCDDYIEVLEIGCMVFRHAYYLDFRQVNPHMSKIELDELIRSKNIFGCGKPFTFDGTTVKICDYI